MRQKEWICNFQHQRKMHKPGYIPYLAVLFNQKQVSDSIYMQKTDMYESGKVQKIGK